MPITETATTEAATPTRRIRLTTLRPPATVPAPAPAGTDGSGSGGAVGNAGGQLWARATLEVRHRLDPDLIERALRWLDDALETRGQLRAVWTGDLAADTTSDGGD